MVQSPIRQTDAEMDPEMRRTRKTGGLAVMLIPARTDTKAFHEYIYGKSEIRFVRGRLHFVNQNGEQRERAPFPSMVVIFK
jgi:hypothetical protein